MKFCYVIAIMLLVLIFLINFACGFREITYQENPTSYTLQGNTWGTGSDYLLLVDGDFNTDVSCYGALSSNNFCHISLYYDKPLYSNASSLWTVKYNDYLTTNFSIPDGCWNYNSSYVLFNITSDADNGISNIRCKNITDWVTLSSSVTSKKVYEEAVWWVYDKTYFDITLSPVNNYNMSSRYVIFNSILTMSGRNYNYQSDNATISVWWKNGTIFNQTFVTGLSGNITSIQRNISGFSNGEYLSNVYWCYSNTTLGDCSWLQSNNTFVIDIMNITIYSPGTSVSSTGIIINATYTANGTMDKCYYNITKGANTEKTNTYINCSIFNDTHTLTLGTGEYIINFWGNTTQGVVIVSNKTFTYSEPLSPGGGGGGSISQPDELTFGKTESICTQFKTTFATAIATSRTQQKIMDKLKTIWISLWDYLLCSSTASIYPI